jgi:hypothetical protein
MTIDSDGIVISDADDDGSTVWAGVVLGEQFAGNNSGVSYDPVDGTVRFESREAYKEALGVESVNVDPEADVNSNGNSTTPSDNKYENSFGRGNGSGENNDASGDNNITEGNNAPSPCENSGGNREIPERVCEMIASETRND